MSYKFDQNLKKNWLSKIFEMTYNMERREQLVCPVDGAVEPSPRDELGRLEWGMDGVRRTGVRDGRTDGRQSARKTRSGVCARESNKGEDVHDAIRDTSGR